MKNKEPSYRLTIIVGVISVVVGLINGRWVVLAGTGYFHDYSPYYVIARAISLELSGFVLDLFHPYSGFPFVFAPLSGALLGAVIGWAASRLIGKSANSPLVKTGAIAGGISGFLSLGIMFLGVYST